LFSLIPYAENEPAKRAIAHPANIRHVSTLPNGVEGLDVGFHIRGKPSKTLATIGRGTEADIRVEDIRAEGSTISTIQCSFEIDFETGVVMLYDRSHARRTQVSGENATPFEPRRIRKVLVQQNLNTIIGMGGKRQDLFQFRLEWHQNPTNTAKIIKDCGALAHSRVENPQLTRTVDATPHTPGQRHLEMRYMKVGPKLGSGQFGTVHKAIDVDSGKFMAVKILERPTTASKQEEWRQSLYYALKREVEALSRISHVSESSSMFHTHEADICASLILLIISRHKAGTNRAWRYLWA
jgi:hypothetical protein